MLNLEKLKTLTFKQKIVLSFAVSVILLMAVGISPMIFFALPMAFIPFLVPGYLVYKGLSFLSDSSESTDTSVSSSHLTQEKISYREMLTYIRKHDFVLSKEISIEFGIAKEDAKEALESLCDIDVLERKLSSEGDIVYTLSEMPDKEKLSLIEVKFD